MKQHLLFLLGLVSLTTSATHIVGGEVHYTYLGNGQYDIEMIVYRDPTGGPLFDDPALLGIFNDNGVEVLTLNFFLDSMNFVPLSEDTCYASGAGNEVSVERGYYHEIVTLPDSLTGYTLVYQRCCRNATIINILTPLDWGATYGTSIPPRVESINSNPRFPLAPPIVVCANESIFYDHSGIDADGDSLSYQFTTPYTGGDPLNPAPFPTPPPHTPIPWAPGYSANNWIDANPTVTIDPQTGIITGTPTTIGQYVTQVEVTEWRNGIPINVTWRDFQMNVVQCLPYPDASVIDNNDSCQGLSATYAAGGTDFIDIEWNLISPDGTQEFLGTDPVITVTRNDTGTYLISLVASNGTCFDTAFYEVWLYEPDIGLQILGPDSACYPVDEPSWTLTPDLPNEGIRNWQLNGIDKGDNFPDVPGDFVVGYNQIIFSQYYRGCLWSDSADVWWTSCVDIEVPNVFTPNGDGENEYWYPFWGEYYPERIEMVIFNRWGVKVFEGASNTPNLWKGWNGVNYSSKRDCPEGTYYWIVQGSAYGETFYETGFLTLLR